MPTLRLLYALAIALLIAAFVGFGISAFYPEPESPERLQELEFMGKESSEEERKLMAEEQEAFQERISDYNQIVSSIAIGAAVLLLVISLLWVSRLPVIGDGTTLGAVFTLFYGLIRALMTDSEQFRFVAVALGLVILIALVYWKFARSQRSESEQQRPTRGG